MVNAPVFPVPDWAYIDVFSTKIKIDEILKTLDQAQSK